MPNLGGDIPQRPAPAPNQTMGIEAQKHGKVDIKRPFTRPASLIPLPRSNIPSRTV